MPKPMVITIDEPEWDIATCDRLAEIIAPAFGHRHVVIDLSAVWKRRRETDPFSAVRN